MRLKRIAAALLPLFLLAGCAEQGVSTDFFAMNTMMSVKIVGKDAQKTANAVETRVNELDKLLSRTREDSAIYKLNRDGAISGSEAAAYVKAASEMAEKTEGYYDPTVAPLTDLWGIGTDGAHVPAQSEIDEALLHVGAPNIQIEGSGTVRLKNGAQIDLGGIAKGMAADECAAIVQGSGASGLLSLGGNIYAVGTNAGKPWKVGIADPDSPQEYVATVAVSDLSVVTTGDYERYFEENGKRYHHVFDPKAGFPVDTDVRSVTVIGAASAKCDAYSTALFVMGREKGMLFCERNDIAAVFIGKDKKIYTTGAVKALCDFEVTGGDKGYVHAA